MVAEAIIPTARVLAHWRALASHVRGLLLVHKKRERSRAWWRRSGRQAAQTGQHRAQHAVLADGAPVRWARPGRLARRVAGGWRAEQAVQADADMHGHCAAPSPRGERGDRRRRRAVCGRRRAAGPGDLARATLGDGAAHLLAALHDRTARTWKRGEKRPRGGEVRQCAVPLGRAQATRAEAAARGGAGAGGAGGGGRGAWWWQWRGGRGGRQQQ